MDPAAILVYVVLGLLILLALGALCAPVRWGVKFAINTCFGFIGLVIAGIFGSFIGLTLSINVITVALTGLLGLPGLGLVILLHILF